VGWARAMTCKRYDTRARARGRPRRRPETALREFSRTASCARFITRRRRTGYSSSLTVARSPRARRRARARAFTRRPRPRPSRASSIRRPRATPRRGADSRGQGRRRAERSLVARGAPYRSIESIDNVVGEPQRGVVSRGRVRRRAEDLRRRAAAEHGEDRPRPRRKRHRAAGRPRGASRPSVARRAGFNKKIVRTPSVSSFARPLSVPRRPTRRVYSLSPARSSTATSREATSGRRG